MRQIKTSGLWASGVIGYRKLICRILFIFVDCFLPGTRLLATENFMSHGSLSSSIQAMPISIHQVLKLSLNSVIVQTCTGI